MLKKILFSICCIGLFGIGFSQPEDYLNMLIEQETYLNSENISDEEKVDLVLQLSIEYSDINPIKADSLLKIGLEIIDKTPSSYPSQKGKYMTINAHVLLSMGEQEKGFVELNKATDYFKSIKDTVNWGVCVIDLSNYYDHYLSNTTKVYEYAEKAIDLFKAVKDTVGIAGGYSILGTTNMNIGDYTHAVEQFTRAINLLDNVKGYDLPFVCYANRGLAYEGMEDYKNALADHKKALELRSESCVGECYVLEAKCIYYNLMLSGDKKKHGIESIQQRVKDVLNPFFKVQILEVLGDYYSETKEWDKANFYYTQATHLTEGEESKLSLLKKLALVNDELLEYQTSSNYYKTIVKLEDSLKYQSYKDQITHWQALYREEEKLEKIKELQHENALKNATITYQNKLALILSSGLLIFCLLSFILFKQKKKINEQNKTLLQKHLKLETDWQNIQEYNKSLKDKIEELNEKFKQEHIPSEKYDQSGLSKEQIERFLSILMYSITEEKVFLDTGITLSLLAEKLGVNRSYLSQVINAEFGKNFNQFINYYRVLEACAHLRHSENIKYTIDYIAQKSGFKSISSFNTAFKKQVGVTPSYYRKEYAS